MISTSELPVELCTVHVERVERMERVLRSVETVAMLVRLLEGLSA